MEKRSQHIARVNRNVLEKSDIYVTDLFGRQTIRLAWCKYHNRYEDVRLFYLESSSKTKHGGQVRAMCIEGWDETEGKLKPDSMSEPAVSLLSFCDGNKNGNS